MIKCLLPLLVMLLLPSAASAQPAQVLTATKHDSGGSSEVQIIAKADHVMVYALTANRGSCQVYSVFAINGAVGQGSFPFSLNFGDQLTADMLCSPIEIEVQTDHGVVPISWDR